VLTNSKANTHTMMMLMFFLTEPFQMLTILFR